MHNYVDLIGRILAEGEDRATRNGPRRMVEGAQLRFNLTEGFPLVTVRKIPIKNFMVEIPWFLSGATYTTFLKKHNVNIWDKNARNGYVGKIYGYQWRRGLGVDQIGRAIHLLKTDPTSTKIMVSAWNPADIPYMALEPCHTHFQLHSNGKWLKLQFYMRSCDAVIGLPTNIAGYALLCHLFGAVTGLQPVEVICSLGNVHIYQNHLEGARKLIERQPRPLPRLTIEGPIRDDLYAIEPSQFSISGYNPHPGIKFEMIE